MSDSSGIPHWLPAVAESWAPSLFSCLQIFSIARQSLEQPPHSVFCIGHLWNPVSSCVLLVVGLTLPCQGSKTEIANEILHFCTLLQMNQRSHQLLAFVFHIIYITQKSLIQNFLLLYLELHKPKWKQIRGTLVFPQLLKKKTKKKAVWFKWIEVLAKIWDWFRFYSQGETRWEMRRGTHKLFSLT